MFSNGRTSIRLQPFQPPGVVALCAIERWRVHDSEFAFKSFATVPLSFDGCRPSVYKIEVRRARSSVCGSARCLFSRTRRGKGERKEEVEKEREREERLDRKRKKRGRNGGRRKRGALKLGRIGDGRNSW